MLETLFWSFLTMTSICIEWIVFDFILNKISKLKNKKLIKNILLILIILITSTFSFIEISPNIKLSLAMFIGLIFFVFNYEVGLLKGIITSLVYWMLLLGFDILSASIVSIINSIYEMEILLKKSVSRIELVVISKLLLILLIPIVNKLKLEKIQTHLEKRELLYISIPIITNILSIVTVFKYILIQEQNNFVQNISIFIMSSLFLLSNISLVFIIYRVMEDSKLKSENKIIKEKMNMQYGYYSKLQENNMKIRKLYHDMKNHMICIQNMYGDNDITKNYLNKISEEISSCEDIYKTGNMILDIILNEKKVICDKNNINFFADVSLSKGSFIDMIDVCSIFSNILDNAIEACEKISDETIIKYIKIRGTIVNDFLVLKAENSKSNEIMVENNNVITDKGDTFLHGIGINSIRHSVEKYNGEVTIEHTEYKFSMIIYIPLQQKHTSHA